MHKLFDQLSSTNLKLDLISDKLQRIGKILVEPLEITKIIPDSNGFSYNEKIQVTSLFENNFTNVVHVLYIEKNLSFPIHIHQLSTEYLITISGSFKVEIDGKEYLSHIGDCHNIPIGSVHNSTSLEPNSAIIAVCIPPEIAYKVKDH